MCVCARARSSWGGIFPSGSHSEHTIFCTTPLPPADKREPLLGESATGGDEVDGGTVTGDDGGEARVRPRGGSTELSPQPQRRAQSRGRGGDEGDVVGVSSAASSSLSSSSSAAVAGAGKGGGAVVVGGFAAAAQEATQPGPVVASASLASGAVAPARATVRSLLGQSGGGPGGGGPGGSGGGGTALPAPVPPAAPSIPAWVLAVPHPPRVDPKALQRIVERAEE
jgi:hypothetical protein